MSWPLPSELTDDALENKLFARNGVKQGTRRRTEPNWAHLAVELKKPGVTLLILWEEYRGSHPDGYGYSRFCELLRGFKQRLSPTMRQEHAAGDKVFVDYSGKKIPIVDRKTGEIREAEIFVAVLGASSYTFAEATWTQTLPDWIGSHVRMFRFFHGRSQTRGPRQSEVGRQSCQLLRSRDQPQLRHDGISLWRRRSSGTAATAEGQGNCFIVSPVRLMAR
ncbi:transposase [Mesorhizobium sp. M0306]|uniref:transposase n=1 Tax=Mesorhizobium sp. M0306 TaxID=2956932 RepID=UPI00333BEB8A